MHYKNGREAKNGDMIMLLANFSKPVVGILYDAKPGNDFCNGQVALISASDPCPCLNECLHIDDVKAAITQSLTPPKPEVAT
jgi:hypothetical protein